MKTKKAIIFDCFGVLYPTHVDNFFARHHNLTVGHLDQDLRDKIDLRVDLGEISQLQFYKIIAKTMNMPIADIKREVESGLVPNLTLFEFIKTLKDQYRIGLLSNAGEEEISVIRRDNFADLFDVMTVSYQVGMVKPNPEIFKTCLASLQVQPSECIFVDDSLANVEAARSLGMQVIHYEEFGHVPELLRELVK